MVWNLINCIKERTYAEDVGESGAEEDTED